jgi:hypothetical protein
MVLKKIEVIFIFLIKSMDLPSDMTKLIASYLKHKPYSKMSNEELEKEYEAVSYERNRRVRFNYANSEYLLIHALRKDPIIFKIKNTESRDISKYEISYAGYIYNKINSTQISVVDAVDVRPSFFGQYWTYGDLKWVDYSEFEHKFKL